METITNIRDQLSEFFKKLERKQLIRLIVLAVLVIAVIITIVVVLNRKEYAVLYSGMSDKQEQGEIYTRLRNEGVDVRTVGDSIEVSADVVEQWRMQLSGEGYPKSGRNFNTYAQGSAFGSTDANQQAYADYQKEEDIRRFLTAQDKIADAYVVLSIQRRANYVVTLNQQPSTASVTLTLTDPSTPLTDEEAAAIRGVVATSVSENLLPANISIVDTQMRNYPIVDLVAKEREKDKTNELNPDHYLLAQELQDRFNKSIKELLTPVFGTVGVQTALTLNFDRKVTQSVIFEPPVDGMETGIPISMRNMSESIQNGTAVQGPPGLDENGGAPSYIENNAYDEGVWYSTSEEVNMEVNEIKTLVESAQGTITALSIGVVIPQDYEEFVEGIIDLVAKAVGTSVTNVSVQALPIIVPDTSAIEASEMELAEAYKQAEMIRWIIIMSGIIVVIVLLLIALRTVLKALRPEPEPVVQEEAEDEEAEAALDFIVGEEEEAEPEPEEPTPLTQVQEFIEKDPESVAQLLRNWLSDEFR